MPNGNKEINWYKKQQPVVAWLTPTPGKQWVIKPGEIVAPENPKTRQKTQLLELSARGLTRDQFLDLIKRRIANTPPSIMAEYAAMGKHFRDAGYIYNTKDFIQLEIADVVGVKDLGLTGEFAHQVADRTFPGLREQFPTQSWSEPQPTFPSQWLKFLNR
jgi:hypothetical protein